MEIRAMAKTDFSPYGVSFFPNPTGRFTNGLTVFDFIATHLELPFVPPYRELPSYHRQGVVCELPSYYQQAIFSHGANFASAGSGLLDSTGSEKKIVKFSDQISKFEEFSRRVRKKSHLRNSLYCISIGGNDIHAHYNGPSLNLSDAQFVTLLVGTHGLFRANVSCGLTTPTDLYCNDPDAYLFWDAVHPTQRAYSIFSKEIWGGNSSVMHPINLSTLVLGRNA
ncbi:hypothetical protein SUGI_0184800 [Cryptomeria japonica]|nr:hypothetical protein SUGI_0184800 [Cryptomeria japonica]